MTCASAMCTSKIWPHQNNWEPARQAFDQMEQTFQRGTCLIEERKLTSVMDSRLVLSGRATEKSRLISSMPDRRLLRHSVLIR